MITQERQVAAVAQTSVNFDANSWTVLDLATMPANMTAAQPGADIASILIENKLASTGSAFVVFRNDTATLSAADGFEIEPGGVFSEGQVKNMRYMAFRAAANGGTLKVLLRSYKNATQAPWGS